MSIITKDKKGYLKLWLLKLRHRKLKAFLARWKKLSTGLKKKSKIKFNLYKRRRESKWKIKQKNFRVLWNFQGKTKLMPLFIDRICMALRMWPKVSWPKDWKISWIWLKNSIGTFLLNKKIYKIIKNSIILLKILHWIKQRIL